MPLQKLLDVQRVDLKIQGLETEASNIPRQIKEWESSLDSYTEELRRWKQDTEEKKKEQRQIERLLEQKQVELGKFNTQLPMIKTNREYKAILLEIDSVEKEISDLEEKLLTKMDEVEQVEARMQAKESEFRTARQDIEKEKDRLQERRKALEEFLQGSRSEREGLAADVDSSLMSQYNRIRMHKGGLAIAPLEDEICGACRMTLPPQLVNEVIGGRVKSCPNCSRLLYWFEEQEESKKAEQ